MQEAAAAARRRAAAAQPAVSGRPGGGGVAGSLPGAPLGVEGVEEWCEQQERVVLFNDGAYVAPPGSGVAPPTARPVTALVAA